MTVPCGCCALPGDLLCASADFDLILGSNGGGVVVDPGVTNDDTRPFRVHYTNWSGLGFDGDMIIRYGANFTATPVLQPTQVVMGVAGGSSQYHLTLAFPKALVIRSLRLIDFDGPTNEQVFNVHPELSGVDANFTLGACSGVGVPPAQLPGHGCVRSVASNQNGRMYWPNTPATQVQWSTGLPPGLGVGYPAITISDPTQTPVWACRTADGVIHYYNAAGAEVPAANISPCLSALVTP